MIFKVNLHLSDVSLITYNYQEKLNGFIYKTLRNKNKELFDKLHNNKIIVNNRPLKPFNFSELFFQEKQNFKQGMMVEGSGTWYISSTIKEFNEILKRELLENGLYLEPLNIKVSSVEEVKLNKKTDYFLNLSPTTISSIENGKRCMLSPESVDYIGKLKRNIIKKHHYRTGEQISEDDFSITINNYNTDGALIKYKQRQIKGYRLLMEIKASKSIKETICTLGVGNFNSMGFGFTLPHGIGRR